MKPRYWFYTISLIIIALSCQQMPDKPTYENPFDPQNKATEGDPFHLNAVYTQGKVLLTWSSIQFDELKGYHVYRSKDTIDTFELVATISLTDTTWTDTTIVDGHAYWYRITTFKDDGNESSQSNMAPIQITTDPTIIINNGDPISYEKSIQLTILAPLAKDMWISLDSNFKDGTWQNYQSLANYQLPAKEGKITIYVKVRYADNSISQPFSASVTLDLTSPPMIYIPAGEFTMGSNEGDSDESPKHTVFLDGYWVDKYEVTNKQYASFLSAGNGAHYFALMKINKNNDGSFTAEVSYESQPVIYASYENAQAYAQWRGVSLPTEAQWEKAARGNDSRIYPWGNLLESNRANYWESGDLAEKGNIPYTSPAGYYNGTNWNGYQTKDSPSPYGVYDLAGNVWEWCSDWYQKSYYGQSSAANPSGPGSGSTRVIRGGSWSDEAYYIRTSARSYRLPFERFNSIGFRCVR
jgi:formylglycine-generating enzyme required for sulfatase activity